VAGAPKGNTNALKHGLYAKHFKPEEKAELRQMPWNNFLFEIMGTRSMAGIVKDLTNREMGNPSPDIAKVVPLILAWNTTVSTITLSALRYSFLTGANISLNDSLAEALAGLPLHEPDPLDNLVLDLKEGNDSN